MPAQAAERVSAWFGPRHAVDRIHLTFPARTVTALIGPSGCGKSTFLRTLNRIHEVTPGARLSGSVRLSGRDIYAPDVDPVEVRRSVGMVFQRPVPFPNLSIRGNVLAGPGLAGIPVADPDALVEQMLSAAGLWNEVKDRLGESAGSLSGGQQQRLIIARALALSPQVLLLDEPCSALDPASTTAIEDTIRMLAETITVVLATHNLAQARRVADQTAFLLASEGVPGRVIETGPTEQVFTQPLDARTRDYVEGRFG